jgi:cytochrome c oxidase subunit 4
MERSTRRLVLVWVALLILLALTISATFLPIGPLKPVVNFGIALAKATLIFWFYMHLREESGLVRLAAVGAGAWLVIMLLLMSSDYLTRFWFKAAAE